MSGHRVWVLNREPCGPPNWGTLREFHTRALMLGSVGLDTLRRALSDEVMADDEEDDEDD